jgi:hypothetical protein
MMSETRSRAVEAGRRGGYRPDLNVAPAREPAMTPEQCGEALRLRKEEG